MRKQLRKIFISNQYAIKVDLNSKFIIVTGASEKSIGFETAKTLAQWGAQVIITTRSNTQATIKKMQLKTNNIDGYDLDLTQRKSVINFALWYEKKYNNQLDVLINNAGIHLDLLSQWKNPNLSHDGHEIHWRTNYLGTFHLTQLLLPLLQYTGGKKGNARIINITSKLHEKGNNINLFEPLEPYNSWTAYGLSKLALIHMTNELQTKYSESSNIQSFSLHPGSVFSNIATKGLEGNAFIEKVRNLLSPIEAFFLLTPYEGSQTSIHCATEPILKGGGYYINCKEHPPHKNSTDMSISKKLWRETIKWFEEQ